MAQLQSTVLDIITDIFNGALFSFFFCVSFFFFFFCVGLSSGNAIIDILAITVPAAGTSGDGVESGPLVTDHAGDAVLVGIAVALCPYKAIFGSVVMQYSFQGNEGIGV